VNQRDVWSRVLGLLVLGAGWVLALGSQNPPAPRGEDTPPEAFSAARARQHLEFIAAAPRPVGSARHAEVRDYLVRVLRELGLEVQVQRVPAYKLARPGLHLAATVENVVAVLPGNGEAPGAVLLAAHYDSVPTGPGASDNGTAVAALLETARASRSLPPLQRDLVFLFSDAEENGLLGARAFQQHPPLAREPVAVLNFEARGNGGPSMMFEPSAGNAGLISLLAEVGRPAVATSLSQEVYQRLPNDTDFTELKAARLGLNFGFIEGLTAYHTRLDDLAHVDPRSLQHQGDTMLALARKLGAGPLPRSDGDAVYFNAGPLLVHYPSGWAVPLWGLALLGLLALGGLGLRQRRLRPARLALGLAVALGGVLATALGVWLVWSAMRGAFEPYRAMPDGEPYERSLYVPAFAALALGVLALVRLATRRWLERAEQHAATLLLWLSLAGAMAFALPGASYVFLWPAFFGLLPLALLLLPGRGPGPLARTLVSCACALPALLLIAPLVDMLFTALTLQLAAPLTVLTSLLWLLLLPQLEATVGMGPRLAAVMGGFAAVLFLVGALRSPFDPEHPRPTSLTYLLDASRREALWVSSGPQPDEWTAGVLGPSPQRERLERYLPTWGEPLLHSPAPVLPLPPPEPRITRDETVDGVRTVTVLVRSPRGAPLLELQVEPARPLLGARFAGAELPAGPELGPLSEGEASVFRYWAPPAEGVELTLRFPAGTPLELRVVDQDYALPEGGLAPRRLEAMPAPEGAVILEGTRVTQSLSL
jgi:hypothetical protein